jgi:hypothetical protein
MSILSLLLASLVTQAATDPIELSCTLELEVQPLRAVSVMNERETRYDRRQVVAMSFDDEIEDFGLGEDGTADHAFTLTVDPVEGSGRIRFERDFLEYDAGETAGLGAEALPDRIAVYLRYDEPIYIDRRNGEISGPFELNIQSAQLVDESLKAEIAAGGRCRLIRPEDRIF